MSVALQDGDHEVEEGFPDFHFEQHFFVLHLEDEVDGAVVVSLLKTQTFNTFFVVNTNAPAK